MQIDDICISFLYGAGEHPKEREILRNVKNILSTPIGTCPLYREFGVDMSMLDKPMEIAETLYTIAAVEAVNRWEPRVRVDAVTFTPSLDGKLRAEAVIKYVQ